MITIFEDPRLKYVSQINVDETSLEVVAVKLKDISSYTLLLKRLHLYSITAGLDGSKPKWFDYKGNDVELTVTFNGDVMQAMQHLQLENFLSLNTLSLIQLLRIIPELRSPSVPAPIEPPIGVTMFAK